MKTVFAIVLFVAIAAGLWWFVVRKPPTVDPPKTTPQQASVTVSSFDEFNRDLATRVTSVLVPGGAPDFQVVVTPATDPIGTLYRKGRSVPFDDASCAPPADPTARSMPNAFPSYALDAQIAGQAGLDPALFQGVANLGATLGEASAFSFSILNAQVKTLSDTAIEQVLAADRCVHALRGEMVIVRGYVIGQRRFSTRSNRNGDVNIGITKVGKFDVKADSSGLLTVTDEGPQEFLQILSAVTPPAAAVPGPPRVAALKLPTAGEVGRIYVQQPRVDESTSGREVVSLLNQSGLSVVPQIERMDNNLTPDKAQVRYFNETDKASATKVLESFKQKYPDATLVLLKIPAPAGQIEVWLPRVREPRVREPRAGLPRAGELRGAPAPPTGVRINPK